VDREALAHESGVNRTYLSSVERAGAALFKLTHYPTDDPLEEELDIVHSVSLMSWEGGGVEANSWACLGIGCLMGIISGITTLLILLDAFRPHAGQRSLFERIFGRRRISGVRLSARIGTLPVFWFGGPSLEVVMLSHLAWKQFWPLYVLGLIVTYFLVITVPLITLISSVARSMK
jgi:hypothetical protein